MELIEKLIEKHKVFLEKYQDELKEIENNYKDTRISLKSSEDIISQINEKIGVYKEKIDMYQHECSLLRNEISGILGESRAFVTDDSQLDSLRLLVESKEWNYKFNYDASLEELETYKNNILDLEKRLDGFIRNITDNETRDRLTDLKIKLLEMLNLNIDTRFELQKLSRDLLGSEMDSKKEKNKFTDIKSSFNWLQKRIISHQKALQYWMDKGSEEIKGEAVQ